MNKLLSGVVAISLSTTLYGQDISVSEGWHLKGASENITNLNVFTNDCIGSIWKYDGGWKAFSADSTIKSALEGGLGSSNIMSKINKDEGFWINVKSGCSKTIDTTAAVVQDDSNSGDTLSLTEIQNAFTYNNGLLTNTAGSSIILENLIVEYNTNMTTNISGYTSTTTSSGTINYANGTYSTTVNGNTMDMSTTYGSLLSGYFPMTIPAGGTSAFAAQGYNMTLDVANVDGSTVTTYTWVTSAGNFTTTSTVNY